MAKQPATYLLPYNTIRTITMIKDSLMKSGNWIIEHSVNSFAGEVNKFLAIEEDFREYLQIKKGLWRDELYNEQLRYHMRQGFILKNSIKKIIEMIHSGVNKEHTLKVVNLYMKVAKDSEYKDILSDILDSLTGRTELDIEKVRMRLDNRKEVILR